MSEDYPPGSIWQDDSSLGIDGLVDVYVMIREWVFMGRFKPMNFFSPVRKSLEPPATASSGSRGIIRFLRGNYKSRSKFLKSYNMQQKSHLLHLKLKHFHCDKLHATILVL